MDTASGNIASCSANDYYQWKTGRMLPEQLLFKKDDIAIVKKSIASPMQLILPVFLFF